jgi:acyl-coenzyme A synthetase/AMP-(fatty) acid ligase
LPEAIDDYVAADNPVRFIDAFVDLLHSDGIGRGDTVAGLLPRIPELLVVVLGTWRMGAIYQPLFTAFGPAAVKPSSL